MKPICRRCGHTAHYLGDHLREAHDLSLREYVDLYPDSPTVSQELWDTVRTFGEDRRQPPRMDRITRKIGGIPFRVNADVPEDACLTLPSEYRLPRTGPLAADVVEALISFRFCRHTYIYGPTGVGKDALIHAHSAWTRTPGALFQAKPGMDISGWFVKTGLNREGSYDQEGLFLKLARDGYEVRDDAGALVRRVPYILLISDLDRADEEQVEAFRLLLDSIEGRIPMLDGSTQKVLPGTTIVVTANTAGGGDETGRMVSARPVDASIMNRLGGLEFHNLDWADEEPICRAKYPELVRLCPSVLTAMGTVTPKLREAVATHKLFADFSHRDVCHVLDHAWDIIRATRSVPTNLMQRAFRKAIDKMPDSSNRQAAWNIVDPHIRAGAFNPGDTSHIERELPLVAGFE